MQPRDITAAEVPRPNPGSDAAISAGCLCPVLDNNHGKVAPWPTGDGKGEWWVRGDCTVHTPLPGAINYGAFGESVKNGCGICGHERDRHKPNLAGICIACPCDTWTDPYGTEVPQ